ncbi:DUF308 domain-containing protein [Paracoccus sp. (in: a-proteobacteria)]|uniref:HdeD family acid-resistance protein n=1 Tax=Paracoccus sp. TaxID=267 RepID=UPI00322039BF
MSYSITAASQILRDAVQLQFQRYSLWYMAQGGLIALTGIIAVIFPLIYSTAANGFLGWLLIFVGALQGASLIGSRSSQAFPLHIVSAVLFVVVGVLFLGSPADNLLTISMLLVVLLMVQGISRVVFALSVRPLERWTWVLGGGVFEIVLAILLWVALPASGLWLIGGALGLGLIAEGGALVLLAWQVRGSPAAPAV